MKKLILSFLLVGLTVLGFAQAPETLQHSPTSYVDDFAKMFTPEQSQNLDHIIRSFHDTVQISLVTVPTLNGLDPSEYAVKLGNKWGVGSKSNNGLLIVICPSEHKFFAATGGGIQGDLTDMDCARYYDDLAKPKYKVGDFYGGTLAVLNKYINVLSPSAKEFRAAQEKAIAEQNNKNRSNLYSQLSWVFGFILGIILIIYGISLYRRKIAQDAAELAEIKRNFKTASDGALVVQIKLDKYHAFYKEAVTLKNNFYGLGLNNRVDTNWTKEKYINYCNNYDRYCNDNRELTRQLDHLIADADEKEREDRKAAELRTNTIGKAKNIVKYYNSGNGKIGLSHPR